MLTNLLYERGFKMEQQKELTGYPSIDKHHYKFYRETPIREIEVNQTIYELVFKSNAQNMAAPPWNIWA